MKRPDERGPLGLWLIEEGRKRGWATAKARREGLAAFGILFDPSTYASLEAGSIRNSPRIEAVKAFYASEPPKELSSDPLVAAINELVAELRLERVAQRESVDAILRAIAATVGAPVPQGTPSDSGHEVLAGTPR